MARMKKVELNIESMPLVSIDFMNQTHKEEIKMVEDLQQSLSNLSFNENSEAEITAQLTHWLEHTKAHFNRENELMRETGFPAYPVHSGEHQMALKQLQAVVDGWIENKNSEALRNYVLTDWPNWFLGHVNSMDMVTAQFAVANGYTE